MFSFRMGKLEIGRLTEHSMCSRTRDPEGRQRNDAVYTRIRRKSYMQEAHEHVGFFLNNRCLIATARTGMRMFGD